MQTKNTESVTVYLKRTPNVSHQREPKDSESPTSPCYAPNSFEHQLFTLLNAFLTLLPSTSVAPGQGKSSALASPVREVSRRPGARIGRVFRGNPQRGLSASGSSPRPTPPLRRAYGPKIGERRREIRITVNRRAPVLRGQWWVPEHPKAPLAPVHPLKPPLDRPSLLPRTSEDCPCTHALR